MGNRRMKLTKGEVLMLSAAMLVLAAPPLHAQAGRDPDGQRFEDRDATPRSLEVFDRFMDEHRDLAAQVNQKPALLNDYSFLQSHPDLNQFLQTHPGIRTQINQNAVAFVQLENRLEQPDGRRDLRELDRFLDSHPEVSRRLNENPSLASDHEFLEGHPDFRDFLDRHQQLRSQIDQNSGVFFREERGFDEAGRADVRDRDGDTRFHDADRDRDADARNRDADRDRDADARDRDADRSRDADNRNHDADRDRDDVRNSEADRDRDDHDSRDADRDRDASNRYNDNRDRDRDRDAAQFRQFLDSHREIAEQLEKKPGLVNDPGFVRNHPALQTYLQQHPEARTEVAENHDQFVRQDDRFGQDGDHDPMHEHMANFRRFLDSHESIARDMKDKPEVVKDNRYMDHHPELKTYLDANPQVRTDLMADPHNFVKGAQQGSSGSGSGAVNGSGNGRGTPTGTTGTSTGAAGTSAPPSSTNPSSPTKDKQ